LGETPMLGPFTERQVWFRDLMARWLGRCPPISRLAFLATLMQKVTSHEEACRRLDQYLRHIEVFPDSTDLLYRINRRKPSNLGIENLAINRLSTWSAVKTIKQLSAQAGGAHRVQEREVEYFCAVDLDVNTSHEYPGPTLPRDRLADILGELIQQATDVARRGDVREGGA
jgi:hypothetical protein